MHHALCHNDILTGYDIPILDEGNLHIFTGAYKTFVVSDNPPGNFNGSSGDQLCSLNTAYHTDISRRFDSEPGQDVAPNYNRTHEINVACAVIHIPIDFVDWKNINLAFVC
ncbi:hypothetical protein D3C86_1808600 [compost metagenome]